MCFGLNYFKWRWSETICITLSTEFKMLIYHFLKLERRQNWKMTCENSTGNFLKSLHYISICLAIWKRFTERTFRFKDGIFFFGSLRGFNELYFFRPDHSMWKDTAALSARWILWTKEKIEDKTVMLCCFLITDMKAVKMK